MTMNGNMLSPDMTSALLQAAQGQSANAAAKTQLSAKEMKKIDAASQQFEAVFATEMMKPMFEGIKTDGMFGGGQAEDVFRSILLQEYGKQMAQAGQLGIASTVKAEMIKMQESRDAARQQASQIQTSNAEDETGANTIDTSSAQDIEYTENTSNRQQQ